MPFLRTALCLAVGAAVLAACSKPAGPPAAPGSAQAPTPAANAALPDACALIAQADADAVLSAPGKVSGHEDNDRHATHCNFEAVETTNGVNNFSVSIHQDEDAAEAKTQQTMKKGLYAGNTLYVLETPPGLGDDAFLAVSKPPGPDIEASPLSGMVARQQILMFSKGSRDVEIIVAYFGKPHTTDGVKALAAKLASQI